MKGMATRKHRKPRVDISGGIAIVRLTPAFTCKARLNDRLRSRRTYALWQVQRLVGPHVNRSSTGSFLYQDELFLVLREVLFEIVFNVGLSVAERRVEI